MFSIVMLVSIAVPLCGTGAVSRSPYRGTFSGRFASDPRLVGKTTRIHPHLHHTGRYTRPYTSGVATVEKAPVLAASAGVGIPGTRHRSRNCPCAAPRSFGAAPRHVAWL